MGGERYRDVTAASANLHNGDYDEFGDEIPRAKLPHVLLIHPINLLVQRILRERLRRV